MPVKGFAASSWIWSSNYSSNGFEIFGKVREFGFTGIEIPTMDGQVDTKRTTDALNSSSPHLAPIIIGGGLPQTDLASDDAAVAENGLNYVKRCVKVCADIGGSLVCGPLYSAVGKLQYLTQAEKDKVLQRVIHHFRDACKYAADLGVSIALEPLCRYDTNLINTSAQMRDLVDRIDRENIGILLDTFHMNIEEKSMADAISIAGEKLIHFHACENDRGTPGTGHIDWNRVSEALHKINYDGWISIESFVPFDQNFSSSMRAWRQFENTQDEIAAKGLAFLKTKFN